jgi:hypothetical protein
MIITGQSQHGVSISHISDVLVSRQLLIVPPDVTSDLPARVTGWLMAGHDQIVEHAHQRPLPERRRLFVDI